MVVLKRSIPAIGTLVQEQLLPFSHGEYVLATDRHEEKHADGGGAEL